MKEANVTKTLAAAVVIGFACSWLPISVVDYIDAAHGQHTLPRQAYPTYTFLAYLCSTINPFIYGATNRQFRREYKPILRMTICVRGQNNNDNNNNNNNNNNQVLGNALNVTIRRDDIDICHRMFTGRNASKPRPIIVRIKSYRTKKELYGARKSLKNQNMSQIFQDAGIVYINENLTRMRSQLFAKVWKRKKSEQWHSAWTIDGKIFMKLSLGDHPVRIL